MCFMFLRFPGKKLKGKRYNPLFQYFTKVDSVFCYVFFSHRMKPDVS